MPRGHQQIGRQGVGIAHGIGAWLSRLWFALNLDLIIVGCLEDPWHEPFPQRAIAASVSANDKFLLVLFEREKANTRRNLVCRFEMAQLEAAFERLWNKCQEVLSSSWLETQCKDAMDKPECFMFSWELNERKSLCRRFDGNLTNCGLNASLTPAHHTGWLEKFQPTLGPFVAELPPPESPVVVLAETATEEAILMAFKNGTIMRVCAYPFPNCKCRCFCFAVCNQRGKQAVNGNGTLDHPHRVQSVWHLPNGSASGEWGVVLCPEE